MKKFLFGFLVFFWLSLTATSLLAGEYDFCLARESTAKREMLHVRFNYGTIDPGKEAARVIVSQKFKLADTNSVNVTDYDPKVCNTPEVNEATVALSNEQVKDLASAIAGGDPGKTAVAAGVIAVGTTVTVVKSVGDAGKSVGNSIVNGLKEACKLIFGC